MLDQRAPRSDTEQRRRQDDTQPGVVGVLAGVRPVAGAVLASAIAVALWWTVRAAESGAVTNADPVHLGSWVVLVLGLCVGVGFGLVLATIRGWARSRHALEQELARASLDELTGLMNRIGIQADIERRLADRNPAELVGVLFCDLDRLKVINDSLGHGAGDEVLRVAARRLSTIVRESDSIGRFGGDEFVIVSSGLPTVRDLEILAGRLTDALRRPTVLADSSSQVVSGSIGIAFVGGRDTASSVELLRDADVAMYRAKEEGGGRFAVFDTTLRAHAVARLELEQELRKGVRDGQIAVHYQPIVDCRTGAVDRFEALIRWDHPERGMVRPSDFLSVAGESLLIVELGERVLTEACRQAVSWSTEAGRPFSIAVNIAERQLLDLTLVDTVTRVLALTGLPPAQLELEITEELIMESLDRSLVVLRQLDLIGVRLAIDDFGTSQASLSQLKKLAMVSTLKIDRLFVEDIAEDDVDRKIVAAIVALANSVGMTVVAEGVESTRQARVLDELGVDHLQGFLFSRPAPATELGPVIHTEGRRTWISTSTDQP